jgi:hypothetical protein
MLAAPCRQTNDLEHRVTSRRLQLNRNFGVPFLGLLPSAHRGAQGSNLEERASLDSALLFSKGPCVRYAHVERSCRIEMPVSLLAGDGTRWGGSRNEKASFNLRRYPCAAPGNHRGCDSQMM